MNVDKLPQDIKKKIKANIDKINTLSSTELLEYSRNLYHLKDDLGTNVWDYLFECIEVRKNDLNANNKQLAMCRDAKMINEFKKGMKC